MYQPPAAAYTHFLYEFSELLSSSVVGTDKAMIVGDLNIDDDGFLLDNEPAHCHINTLVLVLTYGLETINLFVVPQNSLLSELTDNL